MNTFYDIDICGSMYREGKMCDPQNDYHRVEKKKTGKIEFNSTETHRADLINFPSFFQLVNARKRRGNLLPLIIVRSLFNHTPKVIRFKDQYGVYLSTHVFPVVILRWEDIQLREKRSAINF